MLRAIAFTPQNMACPAAFDRIIQCMPVALEGLGPIINKNKCRPHAYQTVLVFTANRYLSCSYRYNIEKAMRFKIYLYYDKLGEPILHHCIPGSL